VGAWLAAIAHLERSAGRVATAFNTASAALVVVGDAADADGHGAAVKSRLHALRSELFLARGLADDARARAGQESEIPNFKGFDLGHFPLVLADLWTSDHLSERSRSVNAFTGTRARGTLTLKRR